MRNGDFGADEAALEDKWMKLCREKYPYTLAFRPASEPEPPRVPTPPPGTTAISDYVDSPYVCPLLV